MKVISRSDARAQGLKRYFTGKPCRQGHIVERYVGACSCTECMSLKAKARYEADPEKAKAAAVAWQKANPEKVEAYAAAKRAATAIRKATEADHRAHVAHVHKVQRQCRIERRRPTVEELNAYTRPGTDRRPEVVGSRP